MAQVIVSLSVSILALWWIFGESDLDQISENLKRSSMAVIAAFLFGNVFLHVFRVLRWLCIFSL